MIIDEVYSNLKHYSKVKIQRGVVVSFPMFVLCIDFLIQNDLV